MVLVTALPLAVAAILTQSISAQPQCPENPSPEIWHVKSGADRIAANGTRKRPLPSLREAVRCAEEGAEIRILTSDRGSLRGGILIKDGQRIVGEGDGMGGAHPRITAVEGDAVVLSDRNELAGLHIEVANGSAVFGDNVTGADLHDLLITRLRPVPMERLDPSLCQPAVTEGAFDAAASVVRGCNSRLEPRRKGTIVLLADGKSAPAVVEHSIRRTTIEDGPTDAMDRLWAYGIGVQVAGEVTATVVIEASSITGTVHGIAARGFQRGALTLRVKDSSVNSLLRDGVVASTGFICSGIPSELRFSRDCRGRQWVPESDSKVVLYLDGYRYSDPRQRGLIDDASAIEFYGFDQGRSEIEIHVQDSELIGAAQPAVFNFNVYGYTARQIIDLGCRNPAPGDPQQIGEDASACQVAGYTSAGRNRIFGNAWGGDWSSDLSEVALVGPGKMMAQGNYWGDRSPRDGLGDALGDCSRLNWLDREPIHLESDARCELWHVPGRADPTGIDGRFHLLRDPAR